MKVTFAVGNFSKSHTSGNIACISYDVFARKLESPCVLYNFKCLTETEGLFKVTDSHVPQSSGNI